MANLPPMPQCGVACLVSSLSTTSCAALDTACLCADQNFAQIATSCVLSNCTIRESLIVKNATWSGCGLPEPNQDTTLLALTVVFGSLETIFFILRMLCRAARIAPWGWDDTTIVIAYFLTISFSVGAVLEGHAGLGRNVWTLQPDQITRFLEIFFIYETIYSFVLAVIKISICFLYLRIFPGPRFRIAVWTTQAFNIALLIAFMVADFNQCRPLQFFWLGWDGEQEGSCWDLNAYGWAHAIINIVLDLWMLALPASQVWSLNLPLRKKVNILAMFGFGIFLTIISIIRLTSLRKFVNTTNPTSDFYGVAMWSCIEVGVGLMVACMPAARLFVVHHAPRIFSSIRSSLPNRLYHSGSGSNDSTQSSGPSLSKRLQKKPPFSSLSSRDLDKNRRYSMRVTVTSTGKFASSTYEDSQYELAEEGIRIPDFLEVPGSARLPPPGEYLGLPERLLTPSESQMERSRNIWVTQDVSVTEDVSVTHESNAGLCRSHDVQDEKVETDRKDS